MDTSRRDLYKPRIVVLYFVCVLHEIFSQVSLQYHVWIQNADVYESS